jgi:hypothetical protein
MQGALHDDICGSKNLQDGKAGISIVMKEYADGDKDDEDEIPKMIVLERTRYSIVV